MKRVKKRPPGKTLAFWRSKGLYNIYIWLKLEMTLIELSQVAVVVAPLL